LTLRSPMFTVCSARITSTTGGCTIGNMTNYVLYACWSFCWIETWHKTISGLSPSRLMDRTNQAISITVRILFLLVYESVYSWTQLQHHILPPINISIKGELAINLNCLLFTHNISVQLIGFQSRSLL
jgi:hypothetical protein